MLQIVQGYKMENENILKKKVPEPDMWFTMNKPYSNTHMAVQCAYNSEFSLFG